MDSMTLIAVASAVTAGITIGVGCFGPAMGQGRAVSTALSAIAQQPDAAPTQAINFLVLVWLLQRYLYKPVLAAIAAREQKIAATIKDADTQEGKAKAAGEELRKRNEAFDQERNGLMQQATQAGATERERLFESARRDSALLRVKLAQALDAERAQQLSVRTRAEVFALARKALHELAGVGLEDRMVELLIERLRALPEPQRLALSGTPAAQAQVALVRSADDPSAPGRSKLEAAIHERLGAGVVVRFETVPELICGLEISVAGQKLPWSVADYLSTLAGDVAALSAAQVTAPIEAPAHAL
jgi:F-type H+-transporting ATPase subunit b